MLQYITSYIFLREMLRCLSVTNNRLQMYNEIIGNKQIVRDSWMHEKVS